MTDEEMLEYCKDNYPFAITTEESWDNVKMVFKDGYEQGQQDYQNGLTLLSPKTYLDFSNRIIELGKENAEFLEQLKDKDRQLNKWFLSYNEVIEENKQLKFKLAKMREYIYGNYEPEVIIAKLQEIDENME